jgi:plasmid stability protein
MSTLVLKNLPEQLHERLKAQAAEHRRSLTQEAILVLEQGLLTRPRRAPLLLPPPYVLKGGPLTIEQIEAAIEDGRE